MKESLRTGFSFGLTSAVITTLGLMVGLESSSGSRQVVIGGILTIAIADAFSDALGIHISEESENRHSAGEVWVSTIVTFAAKFLFALTFMLPVLFLKLEQAVIVSIAWGLFILGFLSYRMAAAQGKSIPGAVGEHIAIAIAVIMATHFAGKWIASAFK